MPAEDDLKTYEYIVFQQVARVMRRVPQSVSKDELVGAGRAALWEHFTRSEERNESLLRQRVRGGIIDYLRSTDRLSRRMRDRVKAGECNAGVVSFEDLSDSSFAANEPRTGPKGERFAELTRILALVELLPSRDAEILRATLVEGLEEKQLSARFGISDARVSQLKTRAIERLRAMVLQVRPA